MQPEDRETDEWARRLAGDAAAGNSPETDALRSAVQARDEQARAAAADDQLVRARLMKRLEREGLFADAPKKRSWQPWLGAVAAMLIAVVGVRLFWHPGQPDPGTIYRGIAGSVTVAGEEPEKTAVEVTELLRSMGLQPRRIEPAERITLEVDVDAAQLRAFHDWAAAWNARAVTPGRYRVFITPRAAQPTTEP